MHIPTKVIIKTSRIKWLLWHKRWTFSDANSFRGFSFRCFACVRSQWKQLSTNGQERPQWSILRHICKHQTGQTALLKVNAPMFTGVKRSARTRVCVRIQARFCLARARPLKLPSSKSISVKLTQQRHDTCPRRSFSLYGDFPCLFFFLRLSKEKQSKLLWTRNGTQWLSYLWQITRRFVFTTTNYHWRSKTELTTSCFFLRRLYPLLSWTKTPPPSKWSKTTEDTSWDLATCPWLRWEKAQRKKTN